MIKRLYLSALMVILLISGEVNGGEVSLYADRFESKNNIVYAYGHIVLSYDNNLFIGKRAVYDRNRNVITIRDEAVIIGAKGNKITADSINFEVGKHKITFKNFYHTDETDVWIASKRAIKKDDQYHFDNSFLSSCSIKDPDWSLHFKRADYNATSRYIKLDDVKFYIKDTPVLYTPYLAFSLNRERSSGLLMPRFGLNSGEGFIYSQPYFWAISDSMDLEFDPQIRTKRGAGLFSTFRFADSAVSNGKIRMGYFKDRESFAKEHNLKYSSHYGLEMLYQSSDFLKGYKPKGYLDGLYLNLDLFNDIDYLNLQYNKMFHFENTSRFKESRFNYFLYNSSNYIGIGAKYFIDTKLLNNDTTIQELPNLKYHKFTDNLSSRYLNYSIDINAHNYHRERGVKAYSGDIDIPIEFHTSLMGGYLNFILKEEFKGSGINFSDDIIYGSSQYHSLIDNHHIELNSQLLKAYESGLHTVLFGVGYDDSSLISESRLKFKDIPERVKKDFSLDPYEHRHISIFMHNFWDSNGGNLQIDYLLRNDYYPDLDSRWNIITQELNLNYKNWSWFSRYIYSYQTRESTEITNRVSYNSAKYSIYTNYTWKKDYYGDRVWEKELNFHIRYKHNSKLSLYGEFTYDFNKMYNKDWELGIMYDRECWNMQLIFRQEITPILQDSGVGSIRNNSILFKFNLIPFGGSGLDRRLL